jgi:hypothetical protein
MLGTNRQLDKLKLYIQNKVQQFQWSGLEPSSHLLASSASLLQ